MSERRVRVEDMVVSDRSGGSWIYLLSTFFFVALLFVLPLDPDGNGTGFAWVMIALMAIVGLWLPVAMARLRPGLEMPTFLGPPRADRLLCLSAMVLATMGALLSIVGDRAWLMLLAIGMFWCLLPLVARRLILRDPIEGQIAAIAPLDTRLYRWVPLSFGLIALIAVIVIARRGGSLAAIVALVFVSMWWALMFILLIRRPDRQSVHQPTPAEPGLGPGCLDAFQSVPLLIWPVLLLWLLLSGGGWPGAIETQNTSEPSPTTTAPIAAATSTTVATTTSTNATTTAPTDPTSTTTEASTTTTTTATDELFWIVLSDGTQYPVWGLLDDTDSVAYVLMAGPRELGCLLIQYAPNDVDTWGDCAIRQIGASRDALPLYQSDDGYVLLEIKNADSVNLSDEVNQSGTAALAQSAIVSVWEAPVIPRDMTIVLFDRTFTAIIP